MILLLLIWAVTSTYFALVFYGQSVESAKKLTLSQETATNRQAQVESNFAKAEALTIAGLMSTTNIDEFAGEYVEKLYRLASGLTTEAFVSRGAVTQLNEQLEDFNISGTLTTAGNRSELYKELTHHYKRLQARFQSNDSTFRTPSARKFDKTQERLSRKSHVNSPHNTVSPPISTPSPN